MIKKALLLASVLCVLNQTPVKAEPYSHVTIEITEDYASSNGSFGSIELNGKYIQLPCKASLIFDYSIMGVSGDTSPANLSTLLGEPSNKNTYRYEAGVIKNIAAEVVILLVGVTGGICRVLWRHRRQKRTQEILNTPLDELADSVLKKYGEEDDE